MAGIYAPIITNYPNGVTTVVSNTGTSYEQIINSMGSFVYGVNSMYIQSNTIEQVLQPLRFNQYDVNGTLESYSQVTAIDPFQYQSSINFDLSRDNIALQGRTVLDTQILPSEQLNVILYVTEISNKALMGGTDIFSEDDFYKDYSQSVNEIASIETPDSIVNGIKSIIDNNQQTGSVIVNLGQDLTVSNTQNGEVFSTDLKTVSKTNTISTSVKYTPTIKQKNVVKKNEKSTYWIYVLIGSALVIGYLYNKK